MQSPETREVSSSLSRRETFRELISSTKNKEREGDSAIPPGE